MSYGCKSGLQKKPAAASPSHTASRPLQRAATKEECQCEECKRARLQRSATQARTNEEAPPIVYEVLRSAGQPLEASTRSFMEERLGHDFSRVRIHTDARAAESASAVSARAYTVGRDIVFGGGGYDPNTKSGLGLIAHELAHTVQQRGASSPTGLRIGAASDQFEQEARTVSATIMEGRRYRSGLTMGPGSIQRSPVEEPNAGCGICGDPGPTGSLIHSKILGAVKEKSKYIKTSGVRAEADYYSPGDEENGRLDLYKERHDPDGDVFVDIGEIKPNNKNGRLRGRKDLAYYENKVRSSLEAASRLAGTADGGYKIFLGRFSDLELPSGISFDDPSSGACGAQQQVITLERSSIVHGLYLYSCSPTRRELSQGGLCCREEMPPPLPIPRYAEDTAKEKAPQQRSPANIAFTYSMVLVLAAVIRQIEMMASAAEKVRAATRFCRDHPAEALKIAALVSVAAFVASLSLPALAATTAAAAVLFTVSRSRTETPARLVDQT